uniref:Uncharacterized protein n=1 Tax=Anguilla anguilla TaxID=7936 RepID=A0A0E9PV04_ANGAN
MTLALNNEVCEMLKCIERELPEPTLSFRAEMNSNTSELSG